MASQSFLELGLTADIIATHPPGVQDKKPSTPAGRPIADDAASHVPIALEADQV
jgi:hypothetical protein